MYGSEKWLYFFARFVVFIIYIGYILCILGKEPFEDGGFGELPFLYPTII